MESLCRFCAKPESGIDVFGEEGQKRNLYSKIKLCLPINITMNDGMTTLICDSCIKKLNITYDFHTATLSAQYHLRTLMDTQHKLKNNEDKLDSTPSNLPENSSNEKNIVAVNDLNKSSQNNDHSLKTNDFSSIRIEAVQSITNNMFQNLMPSEEVKKNGKRLSEESDKPDTAKKKERMTVCQYCRKWFPRSIITHHEKLHVKGSITFNCTSCNKDFTEAADFKNHLCEGD